MDPIARRLKRLVADRLGLEPSDLAAGLSLADDLAVDSLDRLELAAAIASTFGVEIPDRAWADIRTYGDLADRVATLVGAHARLDDAAAPRVRVTAEIVRAGTAWAVVRSGRLTPYAVETMVDDLRGRELVGAVDVEVGGADDAALRALEDGLLHVRELGVPVRVHRWGAVSPLHVDRPRETASEPEATATVELSIAAGSLLHALQEERGATVAALDAAIAGAARSLDAVRSAVDAAGDAFSHTVERYRGDVPAHAARHGDRALELLDGRGILRARALPGRAGDVVQGLTQVADELLGCIGSLEVLASATRAATAVTAYAALVRAKESAVLEQARLTNALGADKLEPTEVRTLEALVKAEHLHLEEFTATASPEVRTAYWDLAAGPTFVTVERIERDLLVGAGHGTLVAPDVWFALASAKLACLHDLERLQSDGLRAAARPRQRRRPEARGH